MPPLLLWPGKRHQLFLICPAGYSAFSGLWTWTWVQIPFRHIGMSFHMSDIARCALGTGPGWAERAARR